MTQPGWGKASEFMDEIYGPDEPSPEPGGEPPTDYQSTWSPVDVSSVLDEILSGTRHIPQPTVGRRDDGPRLFYPGRINSVFSEPEAGKTWLSLLSCAYEMHSGNTALYVDFEDSLDGMLHRLIALGVPADQIRKGFRYTQPDRQAGITDRAALLDSLTGVTIVVLDGVTEAMNLFGLKTDKDTDVAEFWNKVPRLIARQGPAVVLLDHVVKNADTRGRWATGSQHKLSGLNGSAFTLESIEPFGVGMKGRSRLYVSKDRPAQVRRHSVRTNGKDWFADMVLEGKEDGSMFANLYPPVVREGPFRPTALMAKISDVLARADKPMSFNEIKARVEGKDAYLRKAIAVLVDEGHVTTNPGPRGATLHTLDAPFEEPS